MEFEEKRGSNRAPLEPVVGAMLAKSNRRPDPSTQSVEEVRQGYKWPQPEALRVDAVASSVDMEIFGEPPLPLRIYTPFGVGPFPILVFYHGSGFVACDLDTHDPMCRNLCAGAGCLVVSVAYRLAPETKFPGATNDCLAALRWVGKNATSFSGDSRIIGVAGDSAGGNLAAVTALRARDEGGPELCAQFLAYPVTDYFEPGTLSYEENAVGYGLSRATMMWFWKQYLTDASEANDYRACPLRAPSLEGLPPAFVMTAEYDPLRDEGEAYARRLAEAGVPTERLHFSSLHHGFLFFPGVVPGASEAFDKANEWLRQAFDKRRAALDISS